jgi:hypothetical protein
MGKKNWRETEAALLQAAGEAAEGIGQLRGKSGNRAQPFDNTENIIDRFDGTLTPEQKERSKRHAERMLGKTPLRESPPNDMPALEKIKLYARSGYHLHHIGTDADFERAWGEAFPQEEEGRKV